VLAGWQMGRAALAAARRLRDGDDPDFARAKIASARFYADHVLSRAHGLRCSVVDGAAGVLALEESQF
jgi:3-(methylthio)propanoyl-CoA dehydrogenase